MCLGVVRKRFKGKGTRVHFGWKVFDSGPGCLRFEFNGLNLEDGDDRRAPTEKWLKAHTEFLNLSAYTTGFHIFDTRKAAEAWMSPDQTLVRVRCKGKLATGLQAWGMRPLPVSVYQYIYIPRIRRPQCQAPIS